MSDTEILQDIARMVRDALQTRVALVIEGSEGVEYETSVIKERLLKDGLNADLRAIRVGEHFRRTTEFNLLQRVHQYIERRIDGKPAIDNLSPEEEPL